MKTPLAALALAALLTGCSFSVPIINPAQTVSYYVLTAPEPTENKLTAPSIGVMPVTLPAYLDRNQLVTRSNDGVGIEIHDFERWGEGLARGVARVLCDTLAQEGRSAVPLRTGIRVDSRLSLELRRFDGALEQDVMLDVIWTWQEGKEEPRGGRMVKSRPAGDSLKSMVEAQSLLIQELAKDIARQIR